MQFKKLIMLTPRKVLLIPLFLVLLFVVWIVWEAFQYVKPIYKPFTTSTNNLNEYRSLEHGFTFLHSKEYELETLSDGTLNFNYADNPIGALPNIRITPATESATKRESTHILDETINKYSNWLIGEWSSKEGSFAWKVTGRHVYDFTTPNNIKGYESYIYLDEIDTKENKVIQTYLWGPLFILMSQKPQIQSIEIFGALEPPKEQLEIMKLFVNSLQFPSSITEIGEQKHYYDPMTGLSFAYPKDFSEIKHNSEVEIFSPTSETIQLQIKVFAEKSNNSLEKIMADYNTNNYKNYDLFNKSETSIDEIKAFKYQWKYKPRNDRVAIKGYKSGERTILLYKGFFISISRLPLEIDPQLQKTYEAILNTVKLDKP